MTREYRITFNVKTPVGYENYAQFYVGQDRASVLELFDNLKGSDEQVHTGILLMELREMHRGLPIDLQFKTCTLDEVSDNCKIITKEIFKLYTLGQSPPV